jgi:carboxyl-terminal processing protease
MPDAAVLEELKAYLLRRGVAFTDAQFSADRAWIVRNLAKEMYTTAFDADVATQLSAKTDPEVEAAVAAMPKAAALLETARRTENAKRAGAGQSEPSRAAR